jgi:hypothetical protein
VKTPGIEIRQDLCKLKSPHIPLVKIQGAKDLFVIC